MIAGTPTNPFAVRVLGSTIVTPDMAASLHFYRDLMGFAVIGQGRLGGRSSTAPGVGGDGRAYTLIAATNAEVNGGVIRLLEAPAGAKPNRPRPGSTIMDTGFIGMNCLTRDDDESYRRMEQAGIETIAPPIFCHQNGVKPEPGAPPSWDSGDIELTVYTMFGPAGEEIFIARIITIGGKPAPAWKGSGLHAPMSGCVLIARDRWPFFAFYDAVFGVKPTKVQFMQQAMINASVGAPKDSYFHMGGLGEGLSYEWWEYRSVKPEPTPPFPTALDRTGFAMITLAVDDLAKIRSRVQAAGIPVLGEGALPTPAALSQDGFTIRGPLGELIEIIGRTR